MTLKGKSGHIHDLTLSYVKNLAPGLLAELTPAYLNLSLQGWRRTSISQRSGRGIGIDVHRVRKRDYDMRFALRNYETIVGHVSFYYDAGGMFDLEMNAGRYLAGDWGMTTTISANLVADGK